MARWIGHDVEWSPSGGPSGGTGGVVMGSHWSRMSPIAQQMDSARREVAKAASTWVGGSKLVHIPELAYVESAVGLLENHSMVEG